MSDQKIIVADFGSYTTKGGYANDDYPSIVFPTVFCRYKVKPAILTEGPDIFSEMMQLNIVAS